MERFRPNVVLEHDTAWDEDFWKQMRIGAVTFDVVKPCERCIVTTTDQSTGARKGIEPLAVLKTFRNHPELGPLFGQNLVHRTQGAIALKDAAQLLG